MFDSHCLPYFAPLRLLLALSATSFFGCASEHGSVGNADCGSIARTYRAACPLDESDFAADFALACQVIDLVSECPGERAALLSCYDDGFDGFAGAVCGDDLADVACRLESEAFELCVERAPKAPACIGRAADCYDLGVDLCVAQLGCEWTGTCRSSARACVRLEDQTTCDGQFGCEWDLGGEVGRCDGTRLGCGELNSIDACFDQLGCYVLGSRCDGSAASCGDFRSSTGCNQQAGCNWEE
ncbi:MAG: hypothetical protein AB8H86_30170 [Polyangiales bacterium]